MPCARRANSWPNTIDHRGRSHKADTLLTPLGAHSSWLLWGRSRSASFLRGHQNIGRRARAVRMSPVGVGVGVYCLGVGVGVYCLGVGVAVYCLG